LDFIDNNPDDKHFAYETILQGNISPFVDWFLNYHKSKFFGEFRDYNKLAFQTAIEFLLPTNHTDL
ncbi:18447_t:CDS:1, partial [Entrophospora sp. SA101]